MPFLVHAMCDEKGCTMQTQLTSDAVEVPNFLSNKIVITI